MQFPRRWWTKPVQEGPPRQSQAWRRFLRTTTRGIGPTIVVFYLGLIFPMTVLLILVMDGTIQLEGAVA